MWKRLAIPGVPESVLREVGGILAAFLRRSPELSDEFWQAARIGLWKALRYFEKDGGKLVAIARVCVRFQCIACYNSRWYKPLQHYTRIRRREQTGCDEFIKGTARIPEDFEEDGWGRIVEIFRAAKLSDRQWEVLERKIFLGQSYTEIARQMGSNKRAVVSVWRAGKKRLTKFLNRERERGK